jgi:amino acid transporter
VGHGQQATGITTAEPVSAAPAPAVGLVRSLGPVMAIAIVIGTVIGSGIFVKPRVIAKDVNYSGLVALLWIVGGVLVSLGTLAYAEVAVLLPRAGGNYVFLREGYGRLFGFLWGWVYLLVICAASIAALATIFSRSFAEMLRVDLGLWSQLGLTLGTILVLGWVNARGTRWGGGLQVAITAVKVGSLLCILALPVLALVLASSGVVRAEPDRANLQPIGLTDWRDLPMQGMAAAFLGVLWAFHGWMNIASVASEVTRPQRNLPFSLLAGVGTVVFLYLGANLAYYLILSGPDMASLPEGKTVVSAFGERLLGPVGGVLASAAVMCSVFGALNGNILVAPRILYAMGEDALAPYWVRAVHPKRHTPARAIWAMAIWSSVLVLAVAVLESLGVLGDVKKEKKDPFDVLTNFAMFGAVIFETMAVLSIFSLRRKMASAERPYRCPGYPLVPALYALVPAYILVSMFRGQPLEAAAGSGFVALGILVYYAAGLNRTKPLAS